MQNYIEIVNKVLETWTNKSTRQWWNAKTIAGAMFEHDMQKWFPLMTTKKVPFRLVASELEFFIKWITNKERLQNQDNHIRDERCSPDIISYSHNPETQKKMLEEKELWPIYWWQRRNFWAKYTKHNQNPEWNWIDQLQKVIETIKTNPNDRRMIVMARNPSDLHRMALPPCHYWFQVTVLDWKLNLLRNQRSVDVALWLPFNIASYWLLLHLLAKETWLVEWKLVGFLADVHIFDRHEQWLQEQISREIKQLPQITTNNFNWIFNRKHTDSEVKNYDPHPRIKFEIAI